MIDAEHAKQKADYYFPEQVEDLMNEVEEKVHDAIETAAVKVLVDAKEYPERVREHVMNELSSDTMGYDAHESLKGKIKVQWGEKQIKESDPNEPLMIE